MVYMCRQIHNDVDPLLDSPCCMWSVISGQTFSLELEHVARDGQVMTARNSTPGVGSLFEIRYRHWTLSEFRQRENLTAAPGTDRELLDTADCYRKIYPYSFPVAVALAAPSGAAT